MRHENVGCFCACCMKADDVWQLRANLEAAEKSLAALCAAQRVSTADLLKQVDARRALRRGTDHD